MSIIISSASSPASSATATMVPSVTETATAAADLATVGMAIAAERVATIVFRDAIYIKGVDGLLPTQGWQVGGLSGRKGGASPKTY